MSDTRSGRLQLEDLLIAPLQRITRLPILLKEIMRFTESMEDKAKLEKVLETMNENLRTSPASRYFVVSKRAHALALQDR